MPQGDQWKNIAFVQQWKDIRRQQLEDRYRRNAPFVAVNPTPLLTGIPLAAIRNFEPLADPEYIKARELIQWENESLTHRARRVDSNKKYSRKNGRNSHAVPALFARDGAGWILTSAAHRATAGKLEKAQRMYVAGLERKAQRELSCGILGGETHCRSGHSFRVAYECGNRYCVTCGPRAARRLFAHHRDRLLFVATGLMFCDQEECLECSRAIEAKELPHWPPPRGHKPKVVCAKIDFTLKNPGSLPAPEQMRELNQFIKRFCRAIERRFKISRKQYGLAYCDELGGNNSNPHAHGIYVGPWLPQSKERKEISQLWAEITGGSFIISIKYARSFTEALYHAVKYPAKFAERSTPARLADLELVFHRVRRFHTLAAFYNPETPKEEKPPRRKCPVCGEPLSEPSGWKTISELESQGLRDVEEVRSEVARLRGLGGLAPP